MQVTLTSTGETERRDGDVIMRRRPLDRALGNRDLSWFGRARAALAEVGRPDLIDHLSACPGPDPRFPGGFYPQIRDTAYQLPLDDRRLLQRAVDLAVAEWPYHRAHYSRPR